MSTRPTVPNDPPKGNDAKAAAPKAGPSVAKKAGAPSDEAIKTEIANQRREKRKLDRQKELRAAAMQPPPVAKPAKAKARHFGLVLSFLIFVLAPVGGAGWYLYERATDQFVSEVGFTVRREDAPAVSNLLSTLGQVSSSSSTDSDIMFEFVRSTELVQRIDDQMDLRSIYSEFYDQDPVFSLEPGAPLEDLVLFWRRMVLVSYAPSTGLLELEVRAFDADTARDIAEAIFAEGSAMINQLSSIAREDTTRYARDDLAVARQELQDIREALTSFRLQTQIVDPQAAIQGQLGMVNSLQQQLVEALIELDLLEGSTTRSNDPRIVEVQARIAAIEQRIAQEREKFGGGNAVNGQDYATVVAEFERLSIERGFAEQNYATALANLNLALTEAQRQSRYLAAYVGPTLAERATYPSRLFWLALTGLFALLTWATLALIFYSLRDRR